MLRFLWAYLVYTWGGLHRLFGNTNSMRSEHEAAVRYFNKAYEIDPTFQRVRLERGILLFRELGRYNEALADFNALLVDESGYERETLFNRALLYQQIARYQDALADLNAFLDLPPGDYYQEAARMREVVQAMLNE